jgi:uncharacterized protein YxjI
MLGHDRRDARDERRTSGRRGHETVTIRNRSARVRDDVGTGGRHGSSLSTLQTATITPLRDRFSTDVAGGAELSPHRSVVERDFRDRGGRR